MKTCSISCFKQRLIEESKLLKTCSLSLHSFRSETTLKSLQSLQNSKKITRPVATIDIFTFTLLLRIHDCALHIETFRIFETT